MDWIQSFQQGLASWGSISSLSQNTNSKFFQLKANTRWDSKGMIQAWVIGAEDKIQDAAQDVW